MRYLTSAAMALALAASAAVASADTPDNNNKDHHASAPAQGAHPAGAPGGQGAHGGPPPPGAQGAMAGHTRGPPVGTTHTFNGQVTPGATVHGNGQPGVAGAQNYRGYTPNGQGAPTAGSPNGQAGHPPFHVGPQGVQNGQVRGHFNGGPMAGGGNPTVNAAIRGGTPGADRALRGRDSGRGWYNASRFPQQFHAQQRFHAGWVNRPHGWYARTWAFGEFLPFGWYDASYYLDFQDYGLPYPPVGCEWVREGPDAVLVNVWTGEVLSVANGIFW